MLESVGEIPEKRELHRTPEMCTEGPLSLWLNAKLYVQRAKLDQVRKQTTSKKF